MDKNSFLVLLLTALLLGVSAAQASDCGCTADPMTKTYTPDGVVNTWWGGTREWSCLYTCENKSNASVEIRGSHKARYIGKDDGLWGVCDGLVYVNEYNRYTESFVWAFSRVGTFDPLKSTSQDLKSWAQQNCQ